MYFGNGGIAVSPDFIYIQFLDLWVWVGKG